MVAAPVNKRAVTLAPIATWRMSLHKGVCGSRTGHVIRPLNHAFSLGDFYTCPTSYSQKYVKLYFATLKLLWLKVAI